MENKSRTLEEVKQEFVNLSAKAGQIEYQIQVLSEDVELLYNQMKELNFEAAKLQAEEKKEA